MKKTTDMGDVARFLTETTDAGRCGCGAVEMGGLHRYDLGPCVLAWIGMTGMKPRRLTDEQSARLGEARARQQEAQVRIKTLATTSLTNRLTEGHR